MKQARTIGNNIKLLLQQSEMSYQDLAKALAFSEMDIAKICDGRLMITEQDLTEIAEYFDVEVDYLLEEQPKEKYFGSLFICYIHKFHKEKNEQMILDIFDYYCDMKEAITTND